MGSACFNSIGVKPEHCTGPSNAKKGGSCRSEEAGDNKSQMWDEKIEDIPATVIYGGNGASYSSLFVDF